MSAGDRLIARLRAMGVALPDDTRLMQTYAGYRQRNAGAWLWRLWSPGHPGDISIGSQWPLRDLTGDIEITAPDRFGDRHVDPVGRS